MPIMRTDWEVEAPRGLDHRMRSHIRIVEPFSILKPIKDNIGPRVGLAWQVSPKTVVRTGYSLMWDALVNRGQPAEARVTPGANPHFTGRRVRLPRPERSKARHLPATDWTSPR